MLQILHADHGVKEVCEQPPPVHYRDSKGKLRAHTCDVLVTMVSGERISVDVKPESRVIPSGLRKTLQAIKAQVGDAFADTYCICTEAEITRELAENSRLILRCRNMWSRENVAKMARFAETINGAVQIGPLMYHSGLERKAMPAIINLIDGGYFEVSQGIIDHSSYVRLSARNANIAA